ncbi:hypothetical protein [Streptomyces sp. NPDC051183]|uniref:hypothetical protein n=1 Tax=Streptomyces sp. NPDC051183 TaxID=3155165 RepID=UPI00343D503F
MAQAREGRPIGAFAGGSESEDASDYWRKIYQPDEQVWELVTVALAAVEAGDVDHAEAVTRSITHPELQELMLGEVARAWAWKGQVDRAKGLASAIANPRVQAPVLADVACAAARSGDVEQAKAVAGEAEGVARSIIDPTMPCVPRNSAA